MASSGLTSWESTGLGGGGRSLGGPSASGTGGAGSAARAAIASVQLTTFAIIDGSQDAGYCRDRLVFVMLAGVTGSRRILAFDQDEGFLGAASRALAAPAFQFLAVRSPDQVLGQVEAFKPELILLDRAAPGTAFAQVNELLRDSPVPRVFVLADHSERELIRAVQAGAVEVMQKPFNDLHAARLGPLLEELERRS